MIIENTKFKGLKIFKGKIFYDKRGFFRELYQERKLKAHKPIFWCLSSSKKMYSEGCIFKISICKKNLLLSLWEKY